MFNFDLIEFLLFNLLNVFVGELLDVECVEVQVFIDVGEYGLVFEIIVDIYVEEKKIFLIEVLLLIEWLVIVMLMVFELVLVCLQKQLCN